MLANYGLAQLVAFKRSATDDVHQPPIPSHRSRSSTRSVASLQSEPRQCIECSLLQLLAPIHKEVLEGSALKRQARRTVQRMSTFNLKHYSLFILHNSPSVFLSG